MDLWDFDRPAVSEERFRVALKDATGPDAAILRTQLARALGLQRRFDEAEAELSAAAENAADDNAAAADDNKNAAGDGTPLVRVHYHLEYGRLLNAKGDPTAARPHFRAALAEAEQSGFDALAADAAHMLAIVESGEAQIPWAERALAIAGSSADPNARRWVGSVTHNLGWTMHSLQRYPEALELWYRALAFREEQGDAELIRIGRWTVARGLRSLGRYDEALAIQRELAGGDDGYVEEELGELLLALGRPDEARPHFARALALLAELEPERRQRLSRLANHE